MKYNMDYQNIANITELARSKNITYDELQDFIDYLRQETNLDELEYLLGDLYETSEDQDD